MNTVHVEAFDLNLLLAFEALWAERHVTRAAARVGLTQSAMSHALGRLRAQLDDPLFQPTPRGLQPTARAHALAPPLGEALALVRGAVATQAPFSPKELRRTFTIGTTDYGELAFVARLMARLVREAPDVRLSIRPVANIGGSELLSGEHDLVLGVGRPQTSGVRAELLFVDSFVSLLRAGHPATRRPLTLERFLALSHVLVSPQGTGESQVDAALRERGRSRRVVLRIPHFLAAPHVVAESDCIITLPERVARTVAARHGLVIRRTPLALPTFSFSQFWHARNDADPGHQWLRRTLAAVATPASKARAA
ncbi:MAG: transcriptional regulator, LysR family [Myxococcales bacterium]|nr:transcriptional regulator, LysR family [Myxococcales bacterium]